MGARDVPLSDPVGTMIPGVLTLACSALDARPLFWTERDGTRYGYEPAAAELVATELSLATRWSFLQWSDFGAAIERGDADGIWCGSAITPERQARWDYSSPYAVFDESVIVRADEAADTPGKLAGRRVGAIAGSTNMALAESFQDAVTVPFGGETDDVLGDMISALRAGEVDAIVDDDVALVPLAAATEDLKIAFTVPTRNRWGMAMRKDNEELRSSIDAALGAITADGRLRDAWERWLPDLAYPFSGARP